MRKNSLNDTTTTSIHKTAEKKHNLNKHEKEEREFNQKLYDELRSGEADVN